jgi:hypothetical protein
MIFMAGNIQSDVTDGRYQNLEAALDQIGRLYV